MGSLKNFSKNTKKKGQTPTPVDQAQAHAWSRLAAGGSGFVMRFTMGRSGNGLSASLDIKPAVPFAKPTYRGGERQAVAERPQSTAAEDDSDDSSSAEEPVSTISKAPIFKGGNDDAALNEAEEETSGETEEARETEEPSPPKRSLFSKAG